MVLEPDLGYALSWSKIKHFLIGLKTAENLKIERSFYVRVLFFLSHVGLS